MGLTDVIALRLLNAVIVFYFVNKAIAANIAKGKDTYLENFGSGILTSAIGVFLSVIGLWAYILVFRGEAHLDNLATSVIGMNADLELGPYSVALLIEGLTSSMIISFILMQYWKSAGRKLENAAQPIKVKS